MILLPAVWLRRLSDEKTLVCGAGGFCDGKTRPPRWFWRRRRADGNALPGDDRKSDFHQVWKEAVVESGDGQRWWPADSVGPARWIKKSAQFGHAVNTLKKSPGIFLGFPDDYASPEAQSLIEYEKECIHAVCTRRQSQGDDGCR
jgi:enoyl-[acyl-carrier protein] reductase II